MIEELLGELKQWDDKVKIPTTLADLVAKQVQLATCEDARVELGGGSSQSKHAGPIL